ncbi:hypothetical protein [Hyphomicrobium sp.]|uniref:hypothetical protein n=1 Tax=Hyphomicrobium sp. TaxID=82 RepID=UPI001DF9C591|nr:hypothetical protein [Hyphomicrobium sp.]MBY0561536.1 hypothetical protein [Hyphomicrobium sp.]
MKEYSSDPDYREKRIARRSSDAKALIECFRRATRRERRRIADSLKKKPLVIAAVVLEAHLTRDKETIDWMVELCEHIARERVI